MNKKHVQKGHERLAERRAELVGELARLEMRQAALVELLAMVRLAESSGEIKQCQKKSKNQITKRLS